MVYGVDMTIYLDASVLNRIFDDQSQIRIFFEASSILIIFMLIENQIADIVSSDVLLFENAQNPYNERKIFVNSVLKKAKAFQTINDEILRRAQEIEKYGISGIDSLHLACAEELKADYFITCDDKIIKRYNGKLRVKNPIEFIMDIIKEEEK